MLVVLATLGVVLTPTRATAQQEGDGPGPTDDGGGADDDDEQSEPIEEPSYVIIDSPFEALEKSCVEQRNGEACLKAGWAWKQGTGIEKPDLFQAHDLFEAGCVFSNASSCVALGRMYLAMEAGMQLELPKGTISLDFGAASQAFASACRLGMLQACGIWGDINTEPKALLAKPETKVRNIKRDLVQAVQAWTLGCNEGGVPNAADLSGDPPKADPRSCVRLAEFHEQGVGGFGKSTKRAADYYERACMAGDKVDYCKRAARLRAAAPVGPGDDASALNATEPMAGSAEATDEGDAVELDDDRPASQRTAQPRRPKPRVNRFDNPDTGMVEEKKVKPIRFDIELAIGARWTYGDTSIGGMKLRAGVNLWFWLFGLGLETGFHTDKLFRILEREYSRYMHTLSGKMAIPLPINLAIPARLYIVLGAGPTLGSVAFSGGDFLFTWGAREMLQLVIVTMQEQGARQWGAVRFEQQQSWHAQVLAGPEHASQVVLVFGFTFGGWGPTFRRGEQSRPTQIPLAHALPGPDTWALDGSRGAEGLR